MVIRPCHLWEAADFVGKHHRHNDKEAKGKFAIACYEGDELIGVAIGGRPRAQKSDDGKTFEIYRVCTTGYKNSTSFLYSRMKRIAQLMGYRKFITFTLQTESGSSLRAIGAKVIKNVEHQRDWNDYEKKLKSGRIVVIKRKKDSVSKQLKFKWEL